MTDRALCIDQGHDPQSASGSCRTIPPRNGLGGERWLALTLLALPWLVTVLCWRELIPRQPLAGLTLLPGLGTAALLLHHLHRSLGRNHRPGEEGLLFPTLGLANWVTLLRGSAIVALAGFLPLALPSAGALHGPLAWVPGTLYLLVGLADLLDGRLARRSGRVTELGKALDTATDAAGLLIASLLAVLLGRLPLPYLLVGLAYYPFVLGIWLRERRGRVVKPLQPRPYSRIIAGFQMALVGVALLPLITPLTLAIAAYLCMTPLLLGFLRDWLVVSGRLLTDSQHQTIWDRWAAELWTRALPPLLRVFLVGSLLTPLLSQPRPSLASPGQDAIAFCLLLIGMGLLGRLAALVLALIIAITLVPVEPHSLLLFGISLTLALTGTGPYSLWSPEEAMLYRKR